MKAVDEAFAWAKTQNQTLKAALREDQKVSGDVEKWVEAGTQAIKEKNDDDAEATEIHLGYISHDYLFDFVLAACRAFLAAAESDGVVLVRVPDALKARLDPLPYERGSIDGYNAARAAVLAGKVTV